MVAQRIYTTFDDLGDLAQGRILSGSSRSAIFTMRNGRARDIAVIESPTVAKSVIFCISSEAEQHSVLVASFNARCSTLGYAVTDTLSCSPNLIEGLNDGGSHASTQKHATANDAHHTPEQEKFLELIGQAVALDASDIHIAIHSNQTLIHFRMAGELVRQPDWPSARAWESVRSFYNSLAKTKARQFQPDIAQDAEAPLTVPVPGGLHKHVRIRYSDAPTYPDGLHVSMRLAGDKGTSLDPSTPLRQQLIDLGFLPEQVVMIELGIRRPKGVVILGGSTGSGKTTTIAHILARLDGVLNRTLTKLSAEQPVEIVIPGVMQTSLKKSGGDDEGGMGFADACVNMMRRDPDVIYLGETRDGLTVASVVYATLSGHRVYTTLHTNSPLEMPQRLYSMAVSDQPEAAEVVRDTLRSPNNVALLIQQTLVPTLCPHCSIPLEQAQQSLDHGLYERVIKEIELGVDDLRFRGPGCEHCSERAPGYSGRTVCAEVVVPDQKLLDTLHEEGITKAQDYLRSAGESSSGTRYIGLTAADVAIRKMKKGLISPVDYEADFEYIGMKQSMSDGALTNQEVAALAATPAPMRVVGG